MDLELNGKRAIVTGSTAGIGVGIAHSLAREGVRVAINGRSERRGRAVVEEILAAGGDAVLALGDVADDDGAKAAATAALDGLGGVDIVVNNAGGFAGNSAVSSVFNIPPADWLRTFDMNAGAAVRMIQHFGPQMRDRGWGRLIQIASGNAMMPSGETPDYAASKAAMLNVSLGTAKALANTGVTVNTISPGIIYTRSVKAWFRQIGEREGWGDDEAKSEAWVLKNYSPQMVSRIGRPADIGDAVTYLCSPRADFINGIHWRVDGGATPTIT
ncbi:MAG: SDR family oxidoreductase [Alphaproteobacteria bacterium]|nr:SDR family oxidoreductase [Alphaproteobacteria bacterium]